MQCIVHLRKGEKDFLMQLVLPTFIHNVNHGPQEKPKMLQKCPKF